jgi:hypothetical protein
MFSTKAAALLGICAALAACADPPTSGTPAPGASVAASDAAVPLIPRLDESAIAAAPADAAVQQAATGGRATGHVALTLAPEVEEQYSFNAIQAATATDPLAAKGNISFHIFQPGDNFAGRGDVICAGIVGNIARIASTWDSFRLGNQDIDVTGLYLVWTVQDNGEGAGSPPDMASELFFTTSAAVAALHCSVGFILPLMPNEEGNIQVRSE